MENPQVTTQPQFAAIQRMLGRSMQRNVVENDTVRSAFAELAFELELAGKMSKVSAVAEYEPSA